MYFLFSCALAQRLTVLLDFFIVIRYIKCDFNVLQILFLSLMQAGKVDTVIRNLKTELRPESRLQKCTKGLITDLQAIFTHTFILCYNNLGLWKEKERKVDKTSTIMVAPKGLN